MVKLSYQFKAKPNKVAKERLWKLLEVSCRLYNEALSERKRMWEEQRKSLTWYDQCKWWLKKRKEEKNYQILNAQLGYRVLRRLDRAFKRFFEGIKSGQKVGYPRFKKPHRFRTIEFTYGNGCKFTQINGKTGRLYVQNVGVVKFRSRRPLPPEAKIKEVAITYKADGWWITFRCEVPDETLVDPLPPTGRAVGIDVGIENFLALSTGELIDNPKWLKRVEEKIKTKQRILSRKQKGSKRWRRMCKQIAKLHLKIQRQRRDFFWKLATYIVRFFDLICVEDLNIKPLGQGFLSKEIHDASWGIFLNILSYKASRAGRTVIKVPPNGTSQKCAMCGVDVPKDLTVRVHECPNCGFKVHRDVNAALNILKLGLGKARRDTFLREVSCLQEVAWFGLTPNYATTPRYRSFLPHRTRREGSSPFPR